MHNYAFLEQNKPFPQPIEWDVIFNQAAEKGKKC